MVRFASGISIAKYISSSPALYKLIKPVANAYARAAGYRKLGLKYDDLVIEENDTAQKALSRLSERESYDRAYRLRQAMQMSVLHRELPKEQWLKPQEDTRYLQPLIEELEDEEAERSAWDTVKVKKNAH